MEADLLRCCGDFQRLRSTLAYAGLAGPDTFKRW